jgi:hypothetical protein
MVRGKWRSPTHAGLPTRSALSSQPGISTLKCVNFKNEIQSTMPCMRTRTGHMGKPLIDKEKLPKMALAHLPQAHRRWHTPCA